MAKKSGVVIVVSGEDNSGAVLDAVNKHLAEVREHAEDADRSMGQFGATAQRALERLGIYFGVREILRGMEDLIKHSVDLGMELGHLSKQTGISTENLSVLKYAADQTGVEFETLVKGFKKLSTEMFNYEHGSKEARQAFDAIGISQKDLQKTGGDLYAVMELVADRFEKMPDGANKSAIATQLFGRAGQELIPVLDQGASGIETFRSEAENLGLVLDSQTVEKMEQLHKKTVEMQGAFSGLALEITSALSPALEKLANDASELVRTFTQSPKDGLKLMASNFLSNISTSDSPARAISDRLRAEALGDAAAKSKAAAAAHDADSKAHTSPGTGVAVVDDAAIAKYQASLEKWQTAKRQLLEEAAKLDLERQKSASEAMLAELDSAHKQGLISDAQYYAKKQEIQQSEFAAEIADVKRQQEAIASQEAEIRLRKPKDAADKKKNAADMLELQRQSLALDGQILNLDGQRKKAASEIATDTAIALQKSKEQAAELAAQLEKLQGIGSGAQIASSQVKYQDKRKKAVVDYGADSPEVHELDAIQKIEEAKLRLEALDQRISSIETQEKMQELQLEEQLLSRKITEIQYAKDLQGLREQEAAQLKGLQGEYNAVADAAGQAGQDAKVKLEESITGVEQSMQKLTHSFSQDLLPILDALESHPKKWSDAFKKAADDIQKDMMRIANQKLMDAMGLGDNSVGKSGAPGGKSGISGLGGLGGILGKLFRPSGGKSASNGGLATGAGTITDAAVGALQQGRGQSGQGGVIVNVINQGTSQEVSSSGSSGGGLEQQVITIVMKDADTLGPMSKALGGAISMIGQNV